MLQQHKIIVIGAGPSGMAAAIQLKRYGLDIVVIEKEEVGGLLRNANLVENYLGFPEGIKGIDLVNLFRQQMDRIDIPVINETVMDVDYNEKFLITTNKGKYSSEFLVIATGTKPKLLDLVKNSPQLANKVFYDLCQMGEVRDKRVVIIGSGDAAFDYALNLSEYNKVTILNRSNKLKCLPLLYERSKHNKNIEYYENTALIDATISDNKLILSTNDPEFVEIEADYLLAASGREPELDLFGDNFMQLLKELEDKSLFLVGDVKNGKCRQTAISAGDGIKAAMMIYERLQY